MKKILLCFFLLSTFLLPCQTFAQEDPIPLTPVETIYEKARVISATKPQTKANEIVQQVTLRIEKTGQTVPYTNSYTPEGSRELNQNDEIILTQSKMSDGSTTYSITDRYRLTPLLWIAIAFFLIVISAAGKKGVGAILGLGVSLAVILFYIVPQILNGADPLLIAISGSLVIMLVTIYLAHGFSQRTSVAVFSTFLSLVVTGILAVFMVSLLELSGGGSEDAYMLQFSGVSINLKGLLLGGIIIGTLGVLDDITTAQAATVFTLAETNRKLTSRQLISKGLSVGREHITSLVNTLVLAYAGSSLPLFLFFILNPLHQPWWLILNNEMIVEEIARTLAGSIGLILAVPITTCLAAFFSRYKVKIS